MQSIHCKVNGIKNDTEKIQLKKALDKIDGVVQIAIDRVESTVDIDFNSPATEKDIKNCIESSGHLIQ